MELQYFESVAIFTGIYIILGWAMYFPLSAGQFNMGVIGFAAIGAYCSALCSKAGVPFGLSLLASAILGGIAGFLIGYPTLRLRTFAIAIVTIAFSEIVRICAVNLNFVGGSRGIIHIPFFTNVLNVYAVILILAFFLTRWNNSKWGRAAQAMKEDEDVAESMGINLARMKLFVNGVCGFMAALAGVFFAHYTTFIQPAHFGFDLLMRVCCFVFFGGWTYFWGVFLGVAVLIIIPEIVRFLDDWRLVFYGGVLIAILLLRPQGLMTKQTSEVLRRGLKGWLKWGREEHLRMRNRV